MIIEKTNFEDLVLITPEVFEDKRGYFLESFNANKLSKVIKTTFVQDNESLSQKNVLRGMHFQVPPFAQAKLIRVIHGTILDVAVDLRRNSKTYGENYSVILSGNNKKQLYVPEGFAHGFLCLEDETTLIYKCSNYYNPASERSIIWNDKDLDIDWEINDPILADKDRLAEIFSTFDNPF